MSDERTYSEKEISAIFKAAAEKQERIQGQRSKSDGLTLGELQHIGLESGITSELVAEAAATLDLTQENETPSTLLGLPISVGKTVHIGGTLTEDQWLSLVAQMRIIFSAHGKLEHVSSLRSWRNGNLQISFESGPNGDVLRMRSLKGDAKMRLVGTLAGLLMAIVIFGEATVGSGVSMLSMRALMITLMGLVGLGVFAMPVFRLPKWAGLRSGQMDMIADRAKQMASSRKSTKQVQVEQTASTLLDVEKEDQVEVEDSIEEEISIRGKVRS